MVEIITKRKECFEYIELPCSEKELTEFLDSCEDKNIEIETEIIGLNIDIKDVFKINERLLLTDALNDSDKNKLLAYIKVNECNLNDIDKAIEEIDNYILVTDVFDVDELGLYILESYPDIPDIIKPFIDITKLGNFVKETGCFTHYGFLIKVKQ